jgi:hypothetical protein
MGALPVSPATDGRNKKFGTGGGLSYHAAGSLSTVCVVRTARASAWPGRSATKRDSRAPCHRCPWIVCLFALTPVSLPLLGGPLRVGNILVTNREVLEERTPDGDLVQSGRSSRQRRRRGP